MRGLTRPADTRAFDLAQAVAKVLAILTRQQRHAAALLLLMMLVGVLLETLSIGLIVPALAVMIDSGVGHRFPLIGSVMEWLGKPDRGTLVTAFALGIFGAYLVKNLFLAFLVWRQNAFTADLTTTVSQRLFSVYLRQPYAFHLQRNSAALIQNVTNEVDILAVNVVAPAMLLLTESLVLAGLTAMVFAIEPMGAAVAAFVVGTSALLFGRLAFRHNAGWGARRQFHAVQMAQYVQQGLGAVKEVKLVGRESEFLRRYRFHRDQSARVGSLQGTLLRLPQLWLELLAVGGLVALVVAMTSQGLALAAFFPLLGLFAASAFRLMPSVGRIVGACQSLKYGLPAIDRLQEELCLPGDHPGTPSGDALRFERELRLDQVSFQYASRTLPSIVEVSLVIPQGACVGLIGPTGAGKSTLVDILLGLLPSDTGMISVDGVDIQSCLGAWQRNIGYVPQTIFLTDDSLRRNIAFSLPDEQIDDDTIRRAIRIVQLEAFVEQLPHGLDTQIGERGVRLSGGQRQRIGIARALYHDPPLLVLDEATNALDVETENELMATVRALYSNKTMIIVAHRPSTIKDCDLVFRLDQGRRL